jgi:hypothetical protein
VDNPLADKAAAAAAMERPAVPATPALLLASSGSLASVNQEARGCLTASVQSTSSTGSLPRHVEC